MIDSEHVQEVLRTKADGRLFHREGQELEFKEQFNFAGLAEYFRDFAAFANNRGGVEQLPAVPKVTWPIEAAQQPGDDRAGDTASDP